MKKNHMNIWSGEVCRFLGIWQEKTSVCMSWSLMSHSGSCFFCQFPFDCLQDMPTGTSLNIILLLRMLNCINFQKKISEWTLTKQDTFAGMKSFYNSWIQAWQHLTSSTTNTLHIRETCLIYNRCSDLNIYIIG